jgi:chitinase
MPPASAPRAISRRVLALLVVIGIALGVLAVPAVVTAADAAGCPPFAQPSSADTAYEVGDRVAFGGRVYESTYTPNWWSPDTAADLWDQTMCGAPVTATAGDTACPEFRQPYSGDAPYEVGDRVLFDGAAYESTFAPNWWSPADAPQYWTPTTCSGAPTPTPTPSPTVAPDPTPTGDPAPTPTSGVAEGIVFSPYKDIAQAMFWDTGYTMGTTAVDGTPRPLVGPGVTLQSTLPQLDTITLAFATGECGDETWAGVPGPAFAEANIPGLDAAGMDYILGTGGLAGSFSCGSAAGMTAFIDRYASDNLVGVDFDIERGQSEADIRGQVEAAVAVQDRYPGLRFSFTIATLAASDGSHGGVNATGGVVVRTVLASGLRNYTINLMTMDYGSSTPGACVVVDGRCDMGASAIQAVENLRHTYPDVPPAKIEVTPMIGVNDVLDETFTVQDAGELTAYAVREGLAGLHFWSLDRDVPCGSTALSNTCNSTPDVPALGYSSAFLRGLGRL